MIFLRILAFVFLLTGFPIVFAAGQIVKKYGLDRDVVCDFEHEMSEEELQKYKFNSAVIKYKLIGVLIALPGMVLVLIAFR